MTDRHPSDDYVPFDNPSQMLASPTPEEIAVRCAEIRKGWIDVPQVSGRKLRPHTDETETDDDF